MGFVSNSSSSSFVVALKSIPRSAKELQALLFGTQKCLIPSYEDKESEFTCEAASERVYSDLVSHKFPLTYEELLEACEEVGFDTRLYDYKRFQVKDETGSMKTDYDAVHKEIAKRSKVIVDQFIKEHDGCFYYQFTYGDENGRFESVLEHSDIFQRVPHIYINQH